MMIGKKARKMMLIGVTGFVTMGMLVGCGSDSVGSNGGQTSLKGKKLKVATGIYAPFAFKDKDGKMVGFDIDLLNALAEKCGFTYELTPTEYDAMFLAMANGEYDIGMGQVCITDDRKKKMDFTEPYWNAGLQFIVGKNSEITSIDQLKGKKIAVEKGTAAHKYVMEHCKDSQIVVFPQVSAAFMEVEQGRADAMMQDKPNAVYYIKNHPDSNLVLLGDETAKIPDGYALVKNSPYKAELDKALKELKDDGTLKKIEDKWLNI